MKRTYYAGAAIAVVLGIGSIVVERKSVVEAATVQAPRFEVDPLWPKPLPNHWVIGSVIGVGVDANDHVWIIHRQGSLEAKEQYATMKPKNGPLTSPTQTSSGSGIAPARNCRPSTSQYM